jgi:chromate transporter
VVDKYHWMDTQTLMNGIALGTITPGPILITATFIGFWVHKFLGALLATIAIFYPTLLLMVATVPYFDKLTGSKYFNKAIGGILCSFLGLFLSVAVTFARQVDWDYNRVLLALAAFLAMRLKVEIILVVLAGILISVFIFQ